MQAMKTMKEPSERDKKLFQQAMNELNSGDPKKAIQRFEKVRKSWCDNPDIWYLEGLAYGKLGHMDKVISTSNKALKLDPDHFGARCNLANAQMHHGDHESALNNYNKALSIKPGTPDVLDNYGRALSMLGRREEAIEHYKMAIGSRQDFAPAHTSLAKAYRENGQPKEAMNEFLKAIHLDPLEFEAHLGIGHLFCGMGGLDKAEIHFQKALEINKRCIEAYAGLASVERYNANYSGALEFIKKAERITSKKDPILLAVKSDILERSGDVNKAYAILEELATEDRMTIIAVTTYVRLSRKFDVTEKALELADHHLQLPATNEMEKKGLYFNTADLLDKLGRYDEAFEHYQKANNIIQGLYCDRAKEQLRSDTLISRFNNTDYKKMPRANTGSTRPIFILGMPRSGTTLTEQILSTHPDVFGAGELSNIQQLTSQLGGGDTSNPANYANLIGQVGEKQLTEAASDYLRQLDKLDSKSRFVTDKMPHNFQSIGLISLLFPDARIIHCRRNPLDNCLSIYFQDFVWTHDYASNLADIGFFYSEYDRLMSHWENIVDIPILTVQYEDLVDNSEHTSRTLLDFCGLEWDDTVLEFHTSNRSVATASYEQVRQPIYKSSSERWRNYQQYISPLLENYSENILSRLQHPPEL